jgi:cytochrome c
MASSLEGNKIFAAVLTAGIIAVGSGVLSGMLYHPKELEEPAYRVAVAEDDGAAAEAEAAEAVAEEPIGVLLASADPAEGEKIAKKCVACHSFDQGGANKVGPALWDIVNRDIGGLGDFGYSEVLANHEGDWTYENLSGFLAKPKEWAPGTKMNYAGIGKGSDRADLIAYLRSLSDNPAPLPEG